MIYTGKGLTVRICVMPTCYDHWMSFACYCSIKRYLPDADVELVAHGKSRFFNWARRLRLRIITRNLPPVPQNEADRPGILAIFPNCIAIREWSDEIKSCINVSGSACFRQNDEVCINDSLCSNVKSDGYTPLTDIVEGIGCFVVSEWLDKDACFLNRVARFESGNETQTEIAVLNEWRRAALLAVGLCLNQT